MLHASELIKPRLVLFVVLFAVAWCILLSRAAIVQILPNAKLEASHKKLYEKAVKLASRRGAITDRNGVELAGSVTAYSLYVDPSKVEQARKLANKIQYLLKLPAKQTLAKIKDKKKRFAWLARRLSYEQKLQIEGWKLSGLGFIEEYRRVYPQETLAANVLGFVGNEEQGLEGIELLYDAELKGQNVRLHMPRDARGRPLFEKNNLFIDPPRGSDIQLTIDSEIQANLEFELSQTFEKYQAQGATGVVLDVQTSEVLALASFPSYDPNRIQEATQGARRNRVLVDTFEPGSTIKPFIVAGALNKGLIKTNSKFDCENGKYSIGKRTIRDTHPYSVLSVSEILAYSSNICMTKIGELIGDKDMARTLREFGFATRTDVGFPGEAIGVLQKLPWNKHLQSNISFGQGMSATALQVANAYAAIANGGYLRKPSLIKKIESVEDAIEFTPQTIRQVMNEKDAENLRLLLTTVTAPGATGYNGRVMGFPVAGKTGTAQKVDPKTGSYSATDYVSSFVGFLPVNAPRFVVLITVDSPKGDYYGSQVAAPVFSRVAGFTVRHAGVLPVHVSNDKNQATTQIKQNKPTVTAAIQNIPDLTGLTLRQTLEYIAGSGIKLEVKGNGRVAEVSPAIGTQLPEDKKLKLTLKP